MTTSIIPERSFTAQPLTGVVPKSLAVDTATDLLVAQIRALPASVFEFPERMRKGAFSDNYFNVTTQVLAWTGRDPVVEFQIFSKKGGVLAGVPEVIRMLQTMCDFSEHALSQLEVWVQPDGSEIVPGVPFMRIVGPYRMFGRLETPILGIFKMRSTVATNMRRMVEAAGDIPVWYMGARFHDWRTQAGDGYAALIGGAAAITTPESGAWVGAKAKGSQPHAGIACYNGNIPASIVDMIRALRAEAEANGDNPDAVKVTALVDYHNDVCASALATIGAVRDAGLLQNLWGFRLDTSESNIDASLHGMDDVPEVDRRGVNPLLVRTMRQVLDAHGHPRNCGYAHIAVSGGFSPVKTRRLREAGAPMDMIGVGDSITGNNKGDAEGLTTGVSATADIVGVDGREEHKVGRPPVPNPSLVLVDWTIIGK